MWESCGLLFSCLLLPAISPHAHLPLTPLIFLALCLHVFLRTVMQLSDVIYFIFPPS